MWWSCWGWPSQGHLGAPSWVPSVLGEPSPSRWRGPCGAGAAASCPFVPAVPTVPPGNVQTEATNSTTIRFTWNPPSPQFINGINQGYKVRGDSRGSPQKWGGQGGKLLLAESPDFNWFLPDC